MLRQSLALLFVFMLTACVPPGISPTPGPPPESPLIPNQVPVLLENQWRLTEIIYNGARRGFDSIAPILVKFRPGNMDIWACNSIGYYLDTTGISDPNEYRFGLGVSTARQCANGGTEQEGVFLQALHATNRYEVVDDTLILSGEHAKVTFVIDNEASKPADWQ